METVSIVIKGKVQSVYYRASAREKAEELHITGEIRNTADRNVHVIATGSKEALDAFIAWCWQGPEAAKVTDVSATTLPFQPFTKFSILR